MENKICRICLDYNGKELINPCKCNGTNKYVHLDCLNKWRLLDGRESDNYKRCNSCLFIYKPKTKYYLKFLKIFFNIIKNNIFPTLTFIFILSFSIFYLSNITTIIYFFFKLNMGKKNFYVFLIIFPLFNYLIKYLITIKSDYERLFLNRNDQYLYPFLYLLVIFWLIIFPIGLFSFLFRMIILCIEGIFEKIISNTDDLENIYI